MVSERVGPCLSLGFVLYDCSLRLLFGQKGGWRSAEKGREGRRGRAYANNGENGNGGGL